MDAVLHLLTDARGVYIPQNFVEMFDVKEWGLDPESWAIKACAEGPDNEEYWDAWDSILCNAKYSKDGDTWFLHQDGCLWAMCYERMTDEEKRAFEF